MVVIRHIYLKINLIKTKMKAVIYIFALQKGFLELYYLIKN